VALTAAKQLLDAGVGTDLQRFSVLFGLCVASTIAARLEPALALAHEIVAVANRQDDTIYRLVGYRILGMTQVYMGRNREGLESLQQCERYSDPVRQKQLSYRFGTDPGLAALCYKIRALQYLGLHDQARRVTEQVLAELPSHGHAFTVALCNGTVMLGEHLLGDLEACERHSVELVTYCAEKKVEIWRLHSVVYLACVHATREPTEENIAALRTAIDALRPSGACIGDSLYISCLAEALLMAGDVTGAEAALQDAFAFVEQSGERFWLADLHRVEGRIALKRPGSDRAHAEARFLKAIDIARSQEARMLELRAATDLARLWGDAGSSNDPRALLDPILAAIEGGENKRDVRNARALLAEIS
jgi:tetratricopeptide (TPR) repeat protein